MYIWLNQPTLCVRGMFIVLGINNIFMGFLFVFISFRFFLFLFLITTGDKLNICPYKIQHLSLLQILTLRFRNYLAFIVCECVRVCNVVSGAIVEVYIKTFSKTNKLHIQRYFVDLVNLVFCATRNVSLLCRFLMKRQARR